MSERIVEWIIANAINEQARGDPDALAADIIAALEKAGYCIPPEDTALGSQPFDELTPEMRPTPNILRSGQRITHSLAQEVLSAIPANPEVCVRLPHGRGSEKTYGYAPRVLTPIFGSAGDYGD